MSNEFFESYKKSLIEEGSKSKRLKLLPKKKEDLTISEFYFLVDYMSELFEKFNKATDESTIS